MAKNHVANSRGNPFQQDVVGILRALGHVTYETKQLPWVSVKERLPDENEDIIILCKHGAIFNGTYSNNVWFCMDGYIYDTYKGNPIYSSMSSIPPSWEPIAWMPKPKFEE